jgi:hypothetical protein
MLAGIDASRVDLINGKPQNPYVVRSTSFEEDISAGIHNALEEEDKEDIFSKSRGPTTFIQFKLNDGRMFHTSVNLDTTTVEELKNKVFKNELENSKVLIKLNFDFR